MKSFGRFLFGFSFILFLAAWIALGGHHGHIAANLWGWSVICFFVGAGLWIAWPKKRRRE